MEAENYDRNAAFALNAALLKSFELPSRAPARLAGM
jgi:hypothetical protein